MDSERLSELRTIAQSASTQQRWKLYNDGSICANVNGGQHSIAKVTFPKLKDSMEDGRHIAAFDPTTCLALLEKVERLTAIRTALREPGTVSDTLMNIREILDGDGRRRKVVRMSMDELHECIGMEGDGLRSPYCCVCRGFHEDKAELCQALL